MAELATPPMVPVVVSGEVFVGTSHEKLPSIAETAMMVARAGCSGATSLVSIGVSPDEQGGGNVYKA